MKLPDYSTSNGQMNIDYSDFTHNSATAVAFNPNPPTKVPTSYGSKKNLEGRRSARKAYEKAAKTSEPGEGSRFKALAKSAAAGGAKDAVKVAAAAMWKKYGKKGGAALIKKGKS